VLRGEVPQVFQYESLPPPLRVQIINILEDALGTGEEGYDGSTGVYSWIHKHLADECGVFTLADRPYDYACVKDVLLRGWDVELALSLIELCFRAVDRKVRHQPGLFAAQKKPGALRPDDAINKLNRRFKENGVGFRFESGYIIRVDSEVVHAEVVQPALVLLHDKQFEGTNEEFLRAHEHYRHGRYPECLVDCLKSFESTMKMICTLRRWPFNPADTAKPLIDLCLGKGLFPAFLQSQLGSLRSLLESGVPTVRNKLGGHGQGSQPIVVPGELASYGIHLTAANIVLLVEAHKKLP